VNRYTIQFTPKFDTLLGEISKLEGGSKAEAIRRSVATYAFLNKELSKGNRKLFIVEEETGDSIQIVLPASLTASFSDPAPIPVAMQPKAKRPIFSRKESEKVTESSYA
jgi:hypothetical protein